ncbi:MAG: hypothetical protein ACYCX2_02290 [Christensenellales bacterium]
MQSDSPAKNKKGLMAGLIAGGVLLVAAAVILIIFLGGGASLTGPWYNETLQQQLRFHEDNTAVIHTSYGDYEAQYVFDKGTGKGMLTLDGRAVEFSMKGGSLFLKSENGESEYMRGEITIAKATPVASEAPSSAPAITPAITPAATTAPTAAPAAAATATPAPTPTPTAPPLPTPAPSSAPLMTINPSMILKMPKDPIFKLVGTPITGGWVNNTNGDFTLKFFDDLTYKIFYGSTETYMSTYTYNKLTGKGEVVYGTDSVSISVVDDLLTWEDGYDLTWTRLPL